MEFTTQRELLEYLGKNPEDRNLVQRLVIKGDVIREGGVYILVDKDARIRELEEEVERLRDEIVAMKESNGDIGEIKADLEYWRGNARYNSLLIKEVLSITYRKVRSIPGLKMDEDEDTFTEGILDAAKEIIGREE